MILEDGVLIPTKGVEVEEREETEVGWDSLHA